MVQRVKWPDTSSPVAPSCILELNLAKGWCSRYFVLHFISLANLWFLNNLISIITEDCNIIQSYLVVWPLNLLLYVEKEMTSQDSVVVLLAMDWARKQTTGVHIPHNWLMLFWWLQLLTSQKQCRHRSLLMKKWEIRLEMQGNVKNGSLTTSSGNNPQIPE